MRLIVKSLYYLILASIGIAMATVFIVYTLFSRSLPDYTQDLSSSEISTPIEILRDTQGIPHLLAQSNSDAFFALGYVHAQDRFWQMEYRRREAQGRLAGLLGPAFLEKDRRARQLGFYKRAVEDERFMDEKSRGILQAYSAGVNAYLVQLSQNARGRGAPEFYFSSPDITQWRPADSLALLRLRAWENSSNLEDEILRAKLILSIGQDRADQLLGDGLVTSHPSSTAFALTDERTVSGQSLLVVDTVQPISSPSQGYLARLDIEAGPVFGFTYPGIPALYTVLGRNLSFAAIEVQRDTADLAIVPDNLLEEVVEYEQRIPVKGQPTHTEFIRSFGNGIVLPSDLFGLDGLVPADHSVVLQWTGLSRNDQTHAGLVSMLEKGPLAEFATNGEYFLAPFEIVAANRFNIISFDAGKTPDRSPWQDGRSRVPYLAERIEALWTGLNAIEPAADKIESQILSVSDWALKSKRAERMISQRNIHTLSSLQSIQTDTVSEAARALLPLVAKELWFSEIPTPEDQLSSVRAEALDLLAQWNGEMSEHLPEPLIFSAWMWELQRQVIRDEVGPLEAELRALRTDFIEAVFTDQDGMAEWCDITPSAAIETCEDMALRSLNVTLQKLSDAYGPRPTSWLWGEAHLAESKHNLFETGTLMDWAAGIYQPISGATGTLNESYSISTDGVSFATTAAPIARFAIDMSGSEPSQFVLSTGQSGHFLSEFYDNFAPSWRRGEYFPFSFDEEIIRAGNKGSILIQPEN